MEKRILIIEDDEHLLKTLDVRLQHEGYEVLSESSGEKGLELAISESEIDLVLLDVVLSGMDGFSVCRELKKNPKTAKSSIIIFTVAEISLSQLSEKAKDAGANDWLMKPFETQELLIKIKKALHEQEGK